MQVTLNIVLGEGENTSSADQLAESLCDLLGLDRSKDIVGVYIQPAPEEATITPEES